MSIDKEFNRTAQSYDEWMHKAIPHHETLFAAAKNLPPFPDEVPIRVLDLGAGTGLFSWHILSRYTHARFTLVDLAPNMLAVARQRFQGFPNSFDYIVDDFRNLADRRDFDLVISSLAIHHLDHPGKQALFKDIYTSLISSSGCKMLALTASTSSTKTTSSGSFMPRKVDMVRSTGKGLKLGF